MHFKQLIQERCSVRSFSPQKVSDVLVRQLIEAAHMAPSACNNQPWLFIVVDEPDQLKKIHEAYPRPWFSEIRQMIVVCGNHQQSWKRSIDGKDHCDIDIAIATDHLTLMATELGLGTCWVCHFNPQLVSQALNLPIHIEPIVLIPFGYPMQTAVPSKSRQSVNELMYYNSYGNKTFYNKA